MRFDRQTRSLFLLITNFLTLLGFNNVGHASEKSTKPSQPQNVTLRISANEFYTTDFATHLSDPYGIQKFRIQSLLLKHGVVTNARSQIEFQQEDNFIDLTCFDCRILRFNFELAKDSVDNKII